MFPTSWFYSAHLDELFITKHIIYGRNLKNTFIPKKMVLKNSLWHLPPNNHLFKLFSSSSCVGGLCVLCIKVHVCVVGCVLKSW